MTVGYENQEPISGRMNQSDGEILDLSQILTDKGFLVETQLQKLIDEGKVFVVDTTKRAVAQNGTFNILIKTGSKRLRFKILFSAELKARFNSYYNVTVSNNGTPYIPFNLVPDSTVVLGATVFKDAVFTGGALRGDQDIGTGGSSPTKAGGNSNSDLESDFPPNSNCLVRLTNLDSNSAYLSFIIVMYEKD